MRKTHPTCLLADLPVENTVHAHQADYYQAIAQSTQQSDCAPFIHFMLQRILEACQPGTPQVAPEVTPQVSRLLEVLQGEMGREALMQALGLKDARHFRQAYLPPALDASLVEMTQPDSPRSPTQKYRLTEQGRWLANHQEEEEA